MKASKIFATPTGQSLLDERLEFVTACTVTKPATGTNPTFVNLYFDKLARTLDNVAGKPVQLRVRMTPHEARELAADLLRAAGDYKPVAGSERNNSDRADAASVALKAYTDTNSGRYDEEPLEDRAGDLLCDLLHLVRRDGTEGELVDGEAQSDPTNLLDRARANFEEEEQEEAADQEDEEEDSSECSGETCTEIVSQEEPYFATPCGTFCGECMAEHVKACGVCASEFSDEFPPEDIADNLRRAELSGARDPRNDRA